MINFWSILMFLVLLKPVSRAEFKYVCIVWIGNQIREIFTADLRCRAKCRSGPSEYEYNSRSLLAQPSA